VPRNRSAGRKANGETVIFTNVRCPACCTAASCRPPYAWRRAGAFVGKQFDRVDEASVREYWGLRRVAVVRIGDFVGVIAEREENGE